MSLKIQIVSDLHLEFHAEKKKFNFIKPSASILALLGDTCCMGTCNDFNIFDRFIDEILPQYNHIILITGNHEYYSNCGKKMRDHKKMMQPEIMKNIDKKLISYCRKKSPKLHFLNNNSLNLTIGNKQYMILGSTLWSNIPQEEYKRIGKMMNDYNHIYIKYGEKFNPAAASALFAKNYKYLKSKIEEAEMAGKEVIIFTHHRPFLTPSYCKKSTDPAYMSDCSKLFKKCVKLWAYGHTHEKTSLLFGKTLLYSNAKGYPHEKTGYDPTAVIII